MKLYERWELMNTMSFSKLKKRDAFLPLSLVLVCKINFLLTKYEVNGQLGRFKKWMMNVLNHFMCSCHFNIDFIFLECWCIISCLFSSPLKFWCIANMHHCIYFLNISFVISLSALLWITLNHHESPISFGLPWAL